MRVGQEKKNGGGGEKNKKIIDGAGYILDGFTGTGVIITGVDGDILLYGSLCRGRLFR